MAPRITDPVSPRRYTRHRGYFLPGLLVALLLMAARWWWGIDEPASPVATEGTYAITQVIDGDTLRLESGSLLRLQGIDTPETAHPHVRDFKSEPWGPEATAYSKKFVAEAGSRVRITFSPERLDRYGRLLGYVWNGDRLLNEELVYHGLAETRPQYPQSDTIKRRLRKAQDDAQRSRRGLWKEGVPEPSASRGR